MTRARFVFALALLLAGCPAPEVPPGRYTCDPAKDRTVGSAQCPGSSRCGLEGFCHDVGDTATAWRCESADDCEAGFLCGLAANGADRECHDPSVGADYRCATSADCSAGWRCGLDRQRARRCHDPAAPTDWPCDTSDDCVAGWSCGLAVEGGRACHDPSQPMAWPCRADSDCVGGWTCRLADNRVDRVCRDTRVPSELPCLVDADCAGGFRCGLTMNRVQRECHDPTAPRAHACLSDVDCVGGWRCDLGGLCADPSGDALIPAGPLDAGAFLLISPLEQLPLGRLAISPLPSPAAPPWYAFERGGQLRATTITSGGVVRSVELGAALGGPLLVQSPRSVDYQGFPFDRFVEVAADRVYLGRPDGGLEAATLLDDGGVAWLRVGSADNSYSVNAPITELRHGTADPGLFPTTIAFGPDPANDYVLFDGPRAAAPFAFPSRIRNRAGNRIIDMADVITRDGGLECVFALDEAGVWVEQLMRDNSWPLEMVHAPLFGNDVCAPTGLKVTHLESAGPRHLAITAAPRDGGREQVALWNLTPMLARGGGPYDSYCTSILDQPCTPGDAIPYSVELGPCEACPGGQLLSLTPITGATTPELEVRCSVADGGSSGFFRISRRPFTSGLCDRRPLVGRSGLFSSAGALTLPDQTAPGRFVAAGPRGELWTGASAQSAASVLFDRAPVGLAAVGADPRNVIAVGDGVLGVPAPQVGLLTAAGVDLLAVATNDPSWVLTTTGVTTLAQGPTLASASTFAVLSSAPARPVSVARARAVTGRTVAVLSSGPNLFAADVDDALAGTVTFVPLELRATSTAPFASLSFPTRTNPDAGVWLEGYGVTSQSVVRVTASSPTRFRLTDLTLPAGVLPLETWFSADRARLGTTTGAVYGLPSRIRLAGPFPEAVAVDFAVACGHELGLSPAGLFRLVGQPNGGEGTWERLSLAGVPPLTDFTDGALHAVGADVYLFTANGTVFRTTIGPCQ
ncbi:MAG: hypothetical protein SFW67_19480 [Myxococcaceae bacterium]|nr:hypothetical protein [Myxococcaceae bacterium]